MKSFEEGVEEAKRIIADDLKFYLRQNAAKAIGSHKTVFPPKRTGELIGNIRVEIKGDELLIWMPFQGQLLEYGTGIYGPKGKPIKAKPGKVLHWKSEGKDFFATHIKGMTPAPFIRPTFHQHFTDIVVNAFNQAFKDVAL